MTLLFTYGTLKQGFCNHPINAGERVPGHYRTRDRLPFYLMGDGHVPCVIHAPGTGHQVHGELYRADAQALVAMDRLERIGQPGGYSRITVALERTDAATPQTVMADIYVRLPADVVNGEQRTELLENYTTEHAKRFAW
jgi:gamma-glutamylaminecyclotransferase